MSTHWKLIEARCYACVIYSWDIISTRLLSVSSRLFYPKLLPVTFSVIKGQVGLLGHLAQGCLQIGKPLWLDYLFSLIIIIVCVRVHVQVRATAADHEGGVGQGGEERARGGEAGDEQGAERRTFACLPGEREDQTTGRILDLIERLAVPSTRWRMRWCVWKFINVFMKWRICLCLSTLLEYITWCFFYTMAHVN